MTDETKTVRRRRPQDTARYYNTVASVGARGNPCTIRIACHNPGPDSDICNVSIGIGPAEQEMARSTAIITPEIWEAIDSAVREALRAAA